MDKAPFNFNPAEKSIFFSNSLYRSVVYYLIFVTAAVGPSWLTSPAACHVVPDVS